MTSPYHDNITVITGASSGIGEALAYELARQGAGLALAARRLDNLESIAEKCRSLGGRAIAIQADVSQQADCQRLIEATIAAYGRVDTLINNAGITMWARFARLEDPALIEQMMKVNFLGAMYCTYYALPHLKQSKGRISNISSMADRLIAPGVSGYVASKHAMEGFFETLRAEVKDDGISVTMLYPGFVDTGFSGRMLNAKGEPGAGIAHMLQWTKQTTPEECARWIARTTWKRKRQALRPVNRVPGWVVAWLKLFAPRVLEWLGREFMKMGGI